MRSYVLTALVIVPMLVATPGAAQLPQEGIPADVRAALEHLPEAWVERARAADWQGVAELYHQDAVVMPIDAPTVSGRDASSGKKFTYYTDCKRVGPEQRKLARGSDLLVLDALRQESHPSHMNIEEATETALDFRAARTLFTHLTHSVEQAAYESSLPPNIGLAYDGLRITL
jgi:hypothetical protein